VSSKFCPLIGWRTTVNPGSGNSISKIPAAVTASSVDEFDDGFDLSTVILNQISAAEEAYLSQKIHPQAATRFDPVSASDINDMVENAQSANTKKKQPDI
jgi:hypothetical protein